MSAAEAVSPCIRCGRDQMSCECPDGGDFRVNRQHAFTPLELRQLHARGLNSESLGDTIRAALEEIRDGAPRCQLCRHWEQDGSDVDEYRRPCGVTPDQYQTGDAAQVVIDDPYCCMMTKANHGCELWEPKR